VPIKNRIADFDNEMREWRHDFHMHPELAYEESRTAGIVAEKLRGWGIEVHEQIGKTGVVGVIKGNHAGSGSIGIRADMDALPLQEMGNPSYKSTVPGKMHACGHDGHTSTLLGAARYLAETRNFAGTVNLIFQPAEEGGAGAKAMIADDLFNRFPCDSVYGLHNMPQLPKHQFAIRKGPLLAAADGMKITINGKGGHAAIPHMTVDPIAIGTQIYQAAQTVVSRMVNPTEGAVVSITQFHAGTANNIILHQAWLAASTRTQPADTRATIRKHIQDPCETIGNLHGSETLAFYQGGLPETHHSSRDTQN